MLNSRLKKGYLKISNKPQQVKHRILLRKLIYRPKADILKAKWLKEFKSKKELKIVTKFIKKYIGKYYKTVARKYFIKNRLINIT